tara:strand:+ start:1579 stop:2058 length:480 start_codon:yes stop_codon:yes gene_type:complete
MEDKSKTNGIGHNSKANEVAYYGQPPITKATLELVRMALEATTKALNWAEITRENYVSAFKGEEPLTDDEKERNAKSAHYNKYVLKNQDVFTKHKLRKLIKPNKLNLNQKHEKFHYAEERYQDCWEEIFNAQSDLEQLLNRENILDMVDEDEVKNVKKN